MKLAEFEKYIEKAVTDNPRDPLAGPKALVGGRNYTRGVAIGTAIAAALAVAALVAMAIFFPIGGLAFMIAGSILGAAVLGLGITAVVYSDRAAQIQASLGPIINKAQEAIAAAA